MPDNQNGEKRQRQHSVQIRTAEGSKNVLLSKDEFVIGRDYKADIRVENPKLSRKHLLVQVAGGKVQVRDLGSVNGSYLAGRLLVPRENYVLANTEAEVCLADVVWIKVSVNAASNKTDLATLTETGAPSQPHLRSPSADFAVERIRSLEKDAQKAALDVRAQAHQDAESVKAQALKAAEEVQQKAEKQAVAIRAKAYKDCEEELRGSYKEIQDLKVQKEELLRAHAELEQMSRQLQVSCDDAEKRTEKALELIQEGEHAKLSARRAEQEKQDFEEESAALKRQIAKTKKELDSLASSIQERTDELATIVAQIKKESEMHDAELRRKVALAAATEAELKSTELQLKVKVGELEVKNLEASRKQDELKNKLEEIQKQIAQCQAEFDSLSDRGAGAESKLHAAEQSIKDRLAELSKLESLYKEASSRAQKTLDGELLARRQSLEQELRDAKNKELEAIKRLEVEADRDLRARRHFLADEIMRAVREVPLANEQLLKSNLVAILNGKGAHTQTVEASERSRKFWKKIAVSVSAPAAVLIVLIMFPGVLQSVKSGLDRKVASEKSDKGVFFDQIKERGMKYAPPQDRTYRDNYASNVLYLERYVEMKLDDAEQKKWILVLNEFLITKLGLSDRIIADFVSTETVLVKQLDQIRVDILPQFKDQGIERMNASEKQDLDRLLQLLKSQENYVKYREFEKSYYDGYISKKPLPAKPDNQVAP